MKLINHTKRFSRNGPPTITVKRIGTIYLSNTLVKSIGAKAGDTISILQNTENPGEWYLSFIEGGVKLRHVGKDTKALLCNSARAANGILETVGRHEMARMIVSTNASNGYYPIVTSSAV